MNAEARKSVLTVALGSLPLAASAGAALPLVADFRYHENASV